MYFNHVALWPCPVHFNQSEAPFTSSMKSSAFLRIQQGENNHGDRYESDCLHLTTWHFRYLNPGRTRILAIRRTPDSQTLGGFLPVRLTSVLDWQQILITWLSLIESLAVTSKLLFRHSPADAVPLTENVLSLIGNHPDG